MEYIPLVDLVVFTTLIIFGAVLVWMAWRYRKAKLAKRDTSPALLLTLSALGILLSVSLVAMEIQQRAPYRYDPAVDQALGRALAELFVTADTQAGDVVILSWGIPVDEDIPVNRTARTRVESFIETLVERGDPKPLVVSPAELLRGAEQLKYNDPSFFMEGFWFIDDGLPHWVLSAMWEKYPDARIFISLEGVPRNRLAELKVAKPVNSRFYALDLFGYGYETIALADSPIDGVVIHQIEDILPSGQVTQAIGLSDNFLFLQP